MKANTGFTLIELLVSLIILTIIVSHAYSGMHRFSQRLKIQTIANDLRQNLNLARSSAITQKRKTIICPSNNGKNCDSKGDWNHGWLVFIDKNHNKTYDKQDQALNYYDFKQTITIDNSQHRKKLVYQRNGFSSGSNTTFSICSTSNDIPAISVIVSNTGRARIAKSTSHKC